MHTFGEPPSDPYPEDLEGIIWTDQFPASDRAAIGSAIWHEVWTSKGGLTLENTRAAREETAWRLLRRSSWMRGVLRLDERLGEIFTRGIDPHDPDFIHTEDAARRVPRTLYQYLAGGLPLIPRPEDGKTVEHAELLRTLGEAMGLNTRPRTAPGFALISSARTLAEAWPRIDDLVQFETRLISTLKRELLEKSSTEATEDLETKFGLSEDEAIGLVAMALRSLEGASHLDNRGGQKARVLAKLERQAKMAEEAFDHRGAAIIQREWWRIFRDEGTVEAEDFDEMSMAIQRGALARRNEPLELPEPQEDLDIE